MKVDEVRADSVDPIYEMGVVRLAKTASPSVMPFDISSQDVLTEVDETEPLFKLHSMDMNMTANQLGDDVHEAYTRRAHEVLNWLQVDIFRRCLDRSEEKYTVKIYLAKKHTDVWFIAEVYDAS